MAGIIGDVLALSKSHSNLDYYYGPYTTLEETYSRVPKKIRGLGLTIGIYQFKEDPNGEYIFDENAVNPITGQIYPAYVQSENSQEQKYSISSIKEYQWKKGLENEDLKEKVEEYILEIDNISYTTDTVNNTITFSIRVTGRGFGVQTNIYLGSNKIISESTVLNENQNIVIKAPENPGNYTYTISAVDSILGNGAQTTHEVIWKEVDVKVINSSPIYSYKVKSLQNLQNSNFSFQIYKIDSVDINRISIIYGNNSTVLYNGDGEYNELYTVNMSQLTGLEAGNLIQIKIEGNMSETFIKDVVQLTSPGIYSSCEGTIPSKVYNGLSFSATFKFEAENIGNYQVVIKDNNQNIVYNSSLLSYNTNTITLTLFDDTLSDIKQSSQHTLYVYIGESQSYNYKFNTLTLLYVPNTEQLSDIDTQTKFKDTLDFNLQENQSLTLQSYILDLNCYIPYIQDNSVLFQFGNITITKDIIQFRGIKYPTPIQQNVSLGFMCNVKSSYQNNDYYYDALFINGVLCYKTVSEGSPSYSITSEIIFIDTISRNIRLYYNTESQILQSPENFVLERNFKSRNPGSETSNLPIFNITPISNILTKADLDDNQIEQIVNNKITIDGTEYDVIDTTSYRVGTFGNLGETKYLLSNIINSFSSAYGVSQQDTEDVIIANIGKKIKKEGPSKIPSAYLTLTRQIVKSKKLLQKYVAVPCQWSYGEYNGYLLAFTQGTSTLEYALPNFTFKFFTDKTFSVKSNVSLIPKIERNLTNLLTYSNEITNETQYYEENELVAKADYMESSHLNNTPTAMFYNAITCQQNGYSVVDSNGDTIQILQNPTQNKLNAIEGIPIVLVINNINYGTFMLNVGKAGKSIGFGSDGISLEGTSNADDSEMSSRFDFATTDTSAHTYLENVSNDISNVTTVNSDFAKFLNDGLEYRYSKADVDEIGADDEEYLRILKMWNWVYTHDTYTKQDFEQMFNFDFAALYYIQMMTFGQTDNLGKNMMIDQFEENGQWYVRPYDMDSQAGLENNGNDNLSPVIEISKEFVLDENTKNIQSVEYLGESSSRFPFSSKTSNLWIRFYNNLRSDIEIFYGQLRNLGYSSEAVISLCEKEVINKLGINQYNKDFKNKYLSNEQPTQQFAFGNRWFRFKDWITKRFDFCDTYFKYNLYKINTRAEGTDYRIKYSIPQYTIYSYNNLGATVIKTDWGTETKADFLKFSSIIKLDMYFSPKYIIDDNNIFQTGFSTLQPRVKLNNLIDYNGDWNNLINVVDLSENTYLQTMTIKNINVISNNAIIPKSLVRLTISDSTIIPELSNFTNLEDVIFSNCEGNISLTNCPNLKSITITGCKNINLNLQGCGNQNRYIDLSISSTNFNQIIFNGSYINYLGLSNLQFNLSFTGEKSYFKVINLYSSTILNGELNISNLVTDTLILNSISTVKVITQEPKVYKYLGLNQSNISQFGNTLDTFDGSYISNLKDITTQNNNTIPRVKMIDSITDDVITDLNNNTYSSSNEFTLKNCGQIKYVINLNINSSVTNLFYRCINLISVENSNITASGYGMFDGCIRLQTLPTEELNQNIVSTIHISNLDCSRMFRSCHALSYNQIEKVLDNNSVTKYWNSTNLTYQNSQIDGVSPTIACKATKYNHFLYNKGYTSNTTIDLSKYAFGTEMQYCFSIHNWGGQDTNNKNTTTDVEITYENKLPKTLTNASYIFTGDNNYKCVIDSNVFTECTVLTNMNSALSNHTFSKNNYFLVVPKLPNNQNLNLDKIFCNSRIDLTNLKDQNDDIFMPSNTISCASGFGLATLSEELEVSELFSKCTNLSNLTCCFNNCTNFTCENILDISFNNLVVNVAGIFANNPTVTIPYGFDGLWYSDPESSNYVINTATINDNNRYGPYYNTKIKINSESINISRIIGSTNYNMKNVFQNATIDNSENPLNIQLTIATKNCNKICQNLKVLDSSPDSQNKVKITLNIQNSGIESADYAFQNVNILDDVNVINLPDTLINCSYMFAGTNLVSIPHGLNACSRLQNISYMFYDCNKINDKIPTNVDYFLPISVTNIDHLFDRCYQLYGGIPNNFIQTIASNETIIDENEQEQEVTTITRNNLKSLVCTFASTSILLSDESFENNNNYGGIDIQTMFPKVTNVEGLFYYMCSSRGSLSYSQPIITTCFHNCTKCDDLFNSAKISIPNQCDFSSATSLRFTFACGYSGISGFAIVLGNKISDMTGMFAATSSVNRNLNILNTNSNVNNVSTLLNMKKGIYTGMLYGYGDDMTKDEYKYVSPSRSIAIYQHS